MKVRINSWLALASAAVLIVSAAAVAPSVAAAGPAHPGANRWILVAKSAQDFSGLRADISAAGGRIINELPDIDTFVVTGGSSLRNLSSDAHAAAVAPDHVEQLVPPDGGAMAAPNLRPHGAGGGSHSKVVPDPAMSLPGLMWNVNRIDAPLAWKTSTGSPAVTVGVADTGLDYTNSELAAQVVHVEDFTGAEGTPTLCQQFGGADMTDADWAAKFGGPANTDWNGHGSWIGGNIAAALDGLGINGIAPSIKLVALKISQWCGIAFDSEILAAFTYAANHRIDVVSISFGGYLDLTQPDQAVIYQQYVKTVAYAMRKGTLIVAAAGNEHVRVGAGGKVLSHGSLTTPGAALVDVYGQYETPGGIPGVIDVSSTGNVVNKPTKNCVIDPNPENTSEICKPTSDAHQPAGIGRFNQLAYYSNYGPRIDIAAPGGARKFNLPVWDGGGTPGFPVTTADGYAAWEDFSITSDRALEIPCYLGSSLGPQFYPNDCYSTIQGTSMATPHVSAVAALIASRNPWLRHQPFVLAAELKLSAQPIFGNKTQPLSSTDTSKSDLTGVSCATGFCHLGGSPIADFEAYGAGLVDAFGH
jgi:lantibiotic leader peptide-processing serine protease